MKYYVNVNDNGTFWYKDAKMQVYHKEDGPAIEYADGAKNWWINGKLHREDGPAVEYTNGYREWYINGKLHREDGPAIEFTNGSKCWYLDGVCYTEAEFNEKMNLVVELTIADIEKILGKKVKIVK